MNNCPDNNPCSPCTDCLSLEPVSYSLPQCPSGEPCEELIDSKCVSYNGPNLPALGIMNNNRIIEVLLKLHKVVNNLLGEQGVAMVSYTATNTTTSAGDPPFNITYVGLGPVYTSTPGATGSTTTITVGSTTGLSIGMSVEVVSGVGVFAPGTVVTAIPSATTFVVSQAPLTALSGGSTIIKATGTEHQIFTLSVLKNAAQTFKAFAGSVVEISGTGTIV